MSKYEWGAIVYGIWFVEWVALELLGYFSVVPWPTLSAEVRWLEDITLGVGAIVIIVGLAILTVHLGGRYFQ